MKITLEMVDEVINRTNVSYKIAKEALETSEGDVLKAIIEVEALQNKGLKSMRAINGQDIIERLKTLVNEGLVQQIIIEKNGRVVVDIPVMAGAIGAVLFTKSTVIAIIAALATGCEIKIVKRDGDVINFKELTQGKFDDFVGIFKGNTKVVCCQCDEDDENSEE